MAGGDRGSQDGHKAQGKKDPFAKQEAANQRSPLNRQQIRQTGLRIPTNRNFGFERLGQMSEDYTVDNNHFWGWGEFLEPTRKNIQSVLIRGWRDGKHAN